MATYFTAHTHTHISLFHMSNKHSPHVPFNSFKHSVKHYVTQEIYSRMDNIIVQLNLSIDLTFFLNQKLVTPIPLFCLLVVHWRQWTSNDEIKDMSRSQLCPWFHKRVNHIQLLAHSLAHSKCRHWTNICWKEEWMKTVSIQLWISLILFALNQGL